MTIPTDLGSTTRIKHKDNRLLAALPAEVFDRLLPDLKLVTMPLGKVIYESGAELEHVYFPVQGCIVSMLYVMADGASAEIAVVGNEGLVGIALFMGGGTMPSRALVQSAGQAFQLKGGALIKEFERHTGLLSLDRLPTNELTMTQELIANMLGVRREGVTEAAGKLQVRGLIRYSRGRITVIDRPGLEAQVCECYAVVKKEYDRLLPPVLAVNSFALARKTESVQE
jgi:CRP-like cAMP-binding protein